MVSCWEKTPECRPSFRCLVSRLEQCTGDADDDEHDDEHDDLLKNVSRSNLCQTLSLFSNQTYSDLNDESHPLLDQLLKLQTEDDNECED